MRSAMAPVISAGVITANVIWNAMNSTSGMVPNTWPLKWPMNALWKSPSQPPSPKFPKASE